MHAPEYTGGVAGADTTRAGLGSLDRPCSARAGPIRPPDNMIPPTAAVTIATAARPAIVREPRRARRAAIRCLGVGPRGPEITVTWTSAGGAPISPRSVSAPGLRITSERSWPPALGLRRARFGLSLLLVTAEPEEVLGLLDPMLGPLHLVFRAGERPEQLHQVLHLVSVRRSTDSVSGPTDVASVSITSM